jgi:hypothetical protein
VSDAIRRLGRFVGVARYLYRKHESVSPARQHVQERPQRPAPARPAPVDYDVPEEPEDLFPPIGGAIPAVVPTDTCPLHGTKWGGSPGDLFHGPKGVTPNGYCRHPDNVKKARAS